MFINWALQEINLKIVYYGPGMSGKTTNLEYIHSKQNPLFQSFSWPFSESMRNLLHNAMVVVSNGPL